MKNECKFLGIEEIDIAITGCSIGICNRIKNPYRVSGIKNLPSGVISWVKI
jgi:hypothetical protein